MSAASRMPEATLAGRNEGVRPPAEEERDRAVAQLEDHIRRQAAVAELGRVR